VSYLNTVPLVWGMLHGPQKGLFDLDFQSPSACADFLAGGQADIGIVPCYELTRQRLAVVPGVSIACRGPVRSILLVSARPFGEIRRLAVDSSSRTSVQLARVILERRYGARPELVPYPPDLGAMLRVADAALVIGDPALRLDPGRLPYRVLDLGAEWFELTGLPMVFAVWAGRPECITREVAGAFRESYRFGQAHLEEIVRGEAPARGFSPDFVRQYFSRHVVFDLGPAESEGMELFLKLAGASTLSVPAASE